MLENRKCSHIQVMLLSILPTSLPHLDLSCQHNAFAFIRQSYKYDTDSDNQNSINGNPYDYFKLQILK